METFDYPFDKTKVALIIILQMKVKLITVICNLKYTP